MQSFKDLSCVFYSDSEPFHECSDCLKMLQNYNETVVGWLPESYHVEPAIEVLLKLKIRKFGRGHSGNGLSDISTLVMWPL